MHHFSQFIFIKVKKNSRKYQTQFRDKLRKLRFMKNYGFLIKKRGLVLASLIFAREASPNYGACTGRSSENNSANRDCASGSSESGTTNRIVTKVWPQNTPYAVVWHMCGCNQLK